MEDLAGVFDEDRPQEAPAPVESDGSEDPAAIVFTSGTTGEPRGVVYAQRYLPASGSRPSTGSAPAPASSSGARRPPAGRSQPATPSSHPGWPAPSPSSTTAASTPQSDCGSAEELGVNVLCQAPTEYRMLAERAELGPGPSLRRLVSAGEPIEPETIAAFAERLGLAIADGYGQTETGQVTGSVAGRTMRPDTARWAGHCRARDPRRRGELQLRASSSPTFF